MDIFIAKANQRVMKQMDNRSDSLDFGGDIHSFGTNYNNCEQEIQRKNAGDENLVGLSEHPNSE